jgi:hypothetical protein
MKPIDPIDCFGPLPNEYLAPILVSPKQAGRLIGRGKTKTWELIAAGRLESVMMDGRRMIFYASILKLIKECQDNATLGRILAE